MSWGLTHVSNQKAGADPGGGLGGKPPILVTHKLARNKISL